MSFKTTSTDAGMNNWHVLLKDGSRWGYPKPMASNPAKPQKKIAQQVGYRDSWLPGAASISA